MARKDTRNRSEKYGPDGQYKPAGRPMMSHVLTRRFNDTIGSKNAVIRQLVLEHRRVDILAEHVLGYDQPTWFQQEMIDFQDSYQEGLILGFRGSRKSTYCTIARVIAEILWDPNVRLLIGSDSFDQAKAFLRPIKQHLEKNETFREIFGDYSSGAEKWSESEIIVNKRTKAYPEATVACVGTGTQFLGRHFDGIILDDLVTEESASTEGQRQKTFDYFYKTLLPCLESPWGRMWIIGTRWHEEDLYGWLQKEDYADAHMIIPVLDEETDESIWEEKFPTVRMHRLRKGNLAAFALQWMLQSSGTVGEIFNKEHFWTYEQLPEDVVIWQGVDLAVGQKEQNDFFSHTTVAIQKNTAAPFLIEHRKMKISFPRQVKFVADQYDKYPQTLAVVAEANAYQDVLRQQVKATYPHVPIVGQWITEG
jgi:hypothetical protein